MAGIGVCESAFSQNSFTVKNAEDASPVANASWEYGSSKGITNDVGQLTINLNDKDELLITNTGFEQVKLSPAQLKIAAAPGIIYLQLIKHVYLAPVTVYAIRNIKSTGAVKLGASDYLEHDAGKVLDAIPGINTIQKSGSYGWDPVMRGFKLEQLNVVTNNGLTALAACPNRMDPPTSQVMLSQMDEIEIVKGPHSFRYGPVVGGMIHFKQLDKAPAKDASVNGRLAASYETNAAIKSTEGIIHFPKGKSVFSIAGGYAKGDNYKDGGDSVIASFFNRGTVGLQWNYHMNGTDKLNLSVTRNFARDAAFPALGMDLLSDDTWLIQAGLQKKKINHWYAQWQLQANASFVDHVMGNRLRPDSYAKAAMQSDAFTHALNLRTEWSNSRGKHSWIAGADLLQNYADGERSRKMKMGPMAGKNFLDTLWPQAYQLRAGVFAEGKYSLKHFVLQYAARLENQHSQADNAPTHFKALFAKTSNNDVNLSLSIGLTKTWTGGWGTGLWLGRGVRSGSITELYIHSFAIGMDPYEIMGNPQLKPEVNYQLDYMLSYKHNNSTLQLQPFYSFVQHYITPVINSKIAPIFGGPGVKEYVNIKRAELYGFEWSWAQQWTPALQQQTTVSYSTGYNKETDEILPEMSPWNINTKFNAMLWKNKLQPYAGIYYTSKRDKVSTSAGEQPSDEFTLIHAGLRCLPVKNIALTFAVNNLTNKTYREPLSRYIAYPARPLNAPGRSFVIAASFMF